jgi:hypothetical protein
MIREIMDRLAFIAKRNKDEDAPIIEFLCDPNDWGVLPEPVPAIKMIPDWFKKIKPNAPDSAGRDQFNGKVMTAKKCMPLLDGMAAGYIMPLFGDLHVTTNENNRIIKLHNNMYGHAGDLHSLDQLGGKTSPTYPGPAVKFINRWVIKTKPGYSTLFIPPMNHIEKRFTCLAAIVDTDTYPKKVNFPAVWHAADYDGFVEAGTPLVTAIPVRRADLAKAGIIRKMTPAEMAEEHRIEKCQHAQLHYYTDHLREPRK